MEKDPEYLEHEEDMELLPVLKICYRQFVSNWGWFLFSSIVCLALGWFYQQTRARIYQRQAVVLIEGSEGTGAGSMTRAVRRSNMSNLIELSGVSVGDNLENEIFILSSKRLMLRVVDKLKLDIDYTLTEALHPVALYGNDLPFTAIFSKKYNGKYAQQFKVSKNDDNTLTLSGFTDKDGNKYADKKTQLGQMTQTPYGELCIVRGKGFGKWENEEITVTRLSAANAANRFMGEITASEYDKQSSLIVLTCNDMNVQRADDILNTLYDTYKEDIVENKNRVALNTAHFIDERISLIGSELSRVESQLASFKKQNRLVDFEAAPQTMVTESSDARKLSLQVETQLNVARQLSDYLNNHTNDHDLIPALNIGDASFNSQISEFNKLMNQRNTMASNSSDQQAVVRELDRQLAQMRNSIRSSIQSYTSSLELRLRDARSNEQSLSGRINSVPDAEKQGLDIQRQQSLKEALYTYLLNKREEVALQQAINEANVRLVEPPIGDNVKVSPRVKVILLVSLLIGLLIPATVLYIRHKLDVTVNGRKDIENATSIPLLGEVPRARRDGGQTNIALLPSDDPLLESFRILRFNLGYMRHNKQVMVVTSTSPGQGKTFISQNFAIILSMSGKKVLLIDADIRKQTASRGLGHNFGLSNYLADDNASFSEFIVPNGVSNGVDFMPAGAMPPNPTELLMSEKFDHLVEELRQQYDHIIIDTTPMLSVADSSIVNRVVDFTLFVIRVGLQERSFLPELERIYKENRLKNLCIVLNDADAKASKYGYGYGVGYGYAAGERKKKNSTRGFFRKLSR